MSHKDGRVTLSAWVDPVLRDHARMAAKSAGIEFSRWIGRAVQQAVAGESAARAMRDAAARDLIEARAELKRVRAEEKTLRLDRDEAYAELESVWHACNAFLGDDSGMESDCAKDAIENVLAAVREREREKSEASVAAATARAEKAEAKLAKAVAFMRDEMLPVLDYWAPKSAEETRDVLRELGEDGEEKPACVCADIDTSDRPCLVCESGTGGGGRG